MITHKKVFLIAFILFCFVAIYHLLAIFFPFNETPEWRSALFVFISLFGAWGFLHRPKYFLYVYIALCIQQFHSHGGSLIRKLKEHGSFDWMDSSVLIFLVIFLVNLIIDWRKRFGPGKSTT